MKRDRARTQTLILALAVLGTGLAIARPSGAEEFPRLAARHAGSGYYEIRGSGDKWNLAEARVVLDARGQAAIDVRGRDLNLALRGRVTEWNSRLHVSIALDSFDGKPTTASGWVEIDGRGGFKRIEFDGQTPVRLGVSFRAKGPNLELPPPPPPVDESEVTEEFGINRKGSDYSDFGADNLRSCQDACRRDSRCQAYSYNTQNRICYLKSRAPNSTNDRDVISGVKRGWDGNRGDGSANAGDGWDGSGGSSRGRLTEERGYDRRGNDYLDFRARDLDDCQAACLHDGHCRAYTYDSRNGACYLKDRVNSQYRNGDRVTGFKDE